MFSIYGVTGKVFSGTLEAMNRVHAISKARPARAIAKKGEEPGVEPTASAVSRPHTEAVLAYRAMLPSEIERGPLYHAEQIMQRMVITVQDEDYVAHAWRTLRDHHIHQAPVLDVKNQLVGIVSERDLLTAINIDDGRIVETLSRRVRDVMTTPVIAAAPVTDIRRVAAVMLYHGVDGAPITDESGRLVGFISRSDVLSAVVTEPPLSLWR
jgi:CBS domain-containing protein